MTEQAQKNVEDMLKDESLLAVFNRLVEEKSPLPISRGRVERILAEPMKESWCHPLVNLAHALLDHHKVVEQPMMLTSLGKSDDHAPIKQMSLHCFYATVDFSSLGILVFSNHGEGGMCASSMDNLIAYHPYPEWLTSKIPQLQAVALDWANQPTKTFDVPMDPYTHKPDRHVSRNNLEI